MKLVRSVLSTLAVLSALVAGSFAQINTTATSDISAIGQTAFYAANYAYWTAFVATGNTTTGSGSTLTVRLGYVTLPDGRSLIPFATNVPITINDALQETVTPTAVSNCNLTKSNGNFGPDAPFITCTITAAFTNLHGAGAPINSGDFGYQEAMNDAGNNGGGVVYFAIDCGRITLSTSAVTTTSTCNVPKNFVNLDGSVFVTTTITTSASYSIGIASATTAYVTSCTSLTAGTNCAGFQTGPTQVSQGTGTGALLITANATAGAGVVHVKVFGYSQAQSSY